MRYAARSWVGAVDAIRSIEATRSLLGGAAIAGMLVTGAAHAQTDFPNRRIYMVVPYSAGGIVDVATRIVTDKLSEIWHQPIVVEAKPGASGNLAWDQVSRAKPDGYTWTFLGPATMANPHMTKLHTLCDPAIRVGCHVEWSLRRQDSGTFTPAHTAPESALAVLACR